MFRLIPILLAKILARKNVVYFPWGFLTFVPLLKRGRFFRSRIYMHIYLKVCHTRHSVHNHAMLNGFRVFFVSRDTIIHRSIMLLYLLTTSEATRGTNYRRRTDDWISN